MTLKRVRTSICIAITAIVGCISGSSALAAPIATTTSMTSSTDGKQLAPGSSIAYGSVLTLVATVKLSADAVTTGRVTFCDATARYCTDIHILGTAQLTSAGIASIKFRPGMGNHSYKAVFAGTNKDAASSSSASELTVIGTPPSYSTATSITQTGAWGAYSLTATVTETGGEASPAGSVSFLDTSNRNAVLATTSLGTGVRSQSWMSPPQTATGYTAVPGDFNEDGIPDLVAANFRNNTLTMLLGKGDGTFRALGEPLTVSAPQSVVVADFNGDGRLDVAAVSFANPSELTILLGNGDGTFEAPTVLQVGYDASSLIENDFNGDGIPDLAFVEEDTGTLLILLGKGNGTFTQSQLTVTSTECISAIASGDFNGDGKQDLVAVSGCEFEEGNSVVILLGEGNGSFQNGSMPQIGLGDGAVAVADFKGDGKLDLAVATGGGSAAMTILLGKGDGTFTFYTLGPLVSTYPPTIAWGDFNGDGIVDLALPIGDTVEIYQGLGNGTFAALPGMPGVGEYPDSVAVTDFNGDGPSDIITADGFDAMSVLLSQPTLTASAKVDGIVIGERI